MKKFLIIGILCTLVSWVYAQNADYKVVFDMTSKDTVNQQAVVRQVTLIRQTNPAASLEVVVYGQGLDLVVKNRSSQQPALEKLLAEKKVAVKVCAATMKRHNIEPSMLVPGVEVVPDGIYEIIQKQREGYGYIKVAH
jgi:uncharacterized protein